MLKGDREMTTNLLEDIVTILDKAEQNKEIQGVTVLKILNRIKAVGKPALLSPEAIVEARKASLRRIRVWRYTESELDKLEGKAIAQAQWDVAIKHYEKV